MISLNKLKRQEALKQRHFTNNFHNEIIIKLLRQVMHNLRRHTLHHPSLLPPRLLILHPGPHHGPLPLTPLPLQNPILIPIHLIHNQSTQTTNILFHFLSHFAEYYGEGVLVEGVLAY